VLAFALLAAPVASAGGLLRDRQFLDLVVAGTDHLLNLDYGEAERAFARVGDVDPSGLVSPFYLAYVQLMRIQDREPTRDELDAFLEAMGAIASKADAVLARHPDDPDLLLLLGMVWGSKAMVDGLRGHYLSAYEGIRRTKQYLDLSVQRDPAGYDAYYGLGLYHYTLSRVSWLVRPLVHLVLPPGDRDRGLRELALASERGTATRMLAKFALLQTYAGLERDYARALPLAEELLRRFPGNPELYFLAALIYSELGRTADALEVGRRIRVNLQQERHHFTHEMWPRYYQLLGKVYMDAGEYATALSFFRKTIEQPRGRYAWVTAWAWTRTGMIHDLLGNRAEATRSYRMALAVETDGIAKDAARQYLQQPYRRPPAADPAATMGDKPRASPTP